MSARADLSTLEASGLIEIASLQPELEYLFRHALVQEAAYASLLKQDRRALHRAAAETILALHPDRGRELAGVVGMHFEQAGETDRAAEQLVVAGEHAIERFANREAIAFFARAAAIASPPQVDVRLRAGIGGAKAGWGYSEQNDFIDRLEAALEDADRGDRRLVAEANSWLVFLRRQQGHSPDSSPELQRALERAARLGGEVDDPGMAALPRALLGSFLAFTGDVRGGAKEMKEALELVKTKGDAVSVAMISDFLALAYARLGEFSKAEETVADSNRIAGDAIARIDVDIATSGVMLERGEAEAAREQAKACSVRAEELGAYACVLVSNMLVGAASLAREDAAGAMPPLQRSNDLCMVTNMAPMSTLVKALLGSARAQLGDMPGGIAGWSEALDHAREMHDRYGEAQTLWGRGRTYLRPPQRDLTAAIADLDRAVELFEAMETKPALARALRDRAEARRDAAAPGAEEDERRSLELARALGLKDFPAS